MSSVLQMLIVTLFALAAVSLGLALFWDDFHE